MSKNILIIDDEELIIKSLSRLLNKEGYDVTTARSGPEALERIKGNDFDLIISDIRMPDMDGIEVIRRIRAYLSNLRKKTIPEIFITGYADRDKYEAAMSLKVADYIYKPFDMMDFLRTVRRFL